LQEVTSYSSSCLSSVELIWINYVSLDPSGRGYTGNHIGAAWLSQHGVILCSAQIWEIFTDVDNRGERV